MLDMFFAPRSVAVVGAARTPGKLGYDVLNNVLQYGFQGQVYPINPQATEILGLRSYPTVLDVPAPIDLAVIVVPNKFVPEVIDQCGRKGVKGAVIISAGFKEAGLEGVKLERQVVATAKKYGLRIVGPNCLGVIDTVQSLNASFAAGMPPRGAIAFMSQSGALCTAVLDWALANHIGFSYFVSLGNKSDVDEVDLMEAWDGDQNSRVMIAYVEGLRDGRRFMDVARRVTRRTPVIAVKSGNTEAGSRAVSSHTGSLAGSNRAYDAALRQAGVLRAPSIQDLFDWAIAFANQPVLRGNRIAIVTNAGGPAIMATDALENFGLKLASLKGDTIERLQSALPAAANCFNPIDVLGDALADRYSLAIEAAFQDPGVDGVMVILTPQVMTRIEETARELARISKQYDKPIVSCFMGQEKVTPGVHILTAESVPNYPFPERAAGALHAMMEYRKWLERPEQQITSFGVDRDTVKATFARVREDGRNTLGDAEARAIAQAYGLRVPKSMLAANSDEAVRFAEEIGYPVVMKIASPDILHKSDIGGIKVGVTGAANVRDAFDLLIYRATRYMPEAQIWGVQIQEMVTGAKEIIIGMSRDPQFGPMLMFGLGGIYVEVLKDVTFRIAPLSRQEAQEMVSEIRSLHLLQGVRGERPSDMEAIVDCILRISQLVTEFPEIVELDINPLLVREAGAGAVAVDMRLVLQQ
ncbi:MAG: acetate--CoA ligase alpha subunit [Anaerolineae bacterium]